MIQYVAGALFFWICHVEFLYDVGCFKQLDFIVLKIFTFVVKFCLIQSGNQFAHEVAQSEEG